jgi:eukaryotic-like serine/threonine-protein kinase
MPWQDNIETILRPGQLVGTQYRVERLIAKGGMAAVWAGVNEHTGKRVALKVILHSFTSNRDAVELFRREALSASKINHPNVVNIFDVIDHEGMTCIVMELLDGETLGSYLTRNGPLSLEKTLSLLLPAMHGVAAANAQGVVHRDLKPANIFLCSGSDGQLITTKVLDFGISVIMRRAGETAPATEQLSMVGTPAYMAPEAIEFFPDIDGRADVYGFGVLFFEALTGKLPFPGLPGLELFKHILTDPPPKVTVYRSDLPIDVMNLIDCALAKNRDDRFADMNHLIRATEDRLLPLLSLPRSLTPLSGISFLPSAESNAGVPVPLVHAAFAEKGSGLRHLGETRVLYSMARESSHTHTRTRQRRISIYNPWRILNHRIAIGAAIVIFLIVAAWAAIPASSNDRAVRQGQSALRAEVPSRPKRPWVVPLPSAPSPVPTPTVPAEIAEMAVSATRTFVHPAALHPSKHGSRPESGEREQRSDNFPNQTAAPRAGRLSLSDF